MIEKRKEREKMETLKRKGDEATEEVFMVGRINYVNIRNIGSINIGIIIFFL